MARNLLGLAKTLRGLSKVPSQIAVEVSRDLNRRLEAGFAMGVDPYGHMWAKLRPATIAKGRFPPPLTDKGAMRARTRLIPMAGAGLKLKESLGGAPERFHMGGTRYMAKRRFFPDAGLPASWRADIRKVAARVFRKASGK